jgi:hypothetical protein
MAARVSPGTEWGLRFSASAAKGWEELWRVAPGNARWAWLTIRHVPAPLAESARHHRLHDTLATGTVRGRVLEHWQIAVTAAVRVWYFVDPGTHTVWIDHVGPGHQDYLA